MVRAAADEDGDVLGCIADAMLRDTKQCACTSL